MAVMDITRIKLSVRADRSVSSDSISLVQQVEIIHGLRGTVI